MTRPSRNTDQLLIEAGRKLVTKTGISGLKVREVATKAKVNLGMFHYHFKNNEEFGRRILSAIYEDFFKQFTLQTGKDGDPLDRLKRALFALATFGRGNRELLLALIQDVMKGHKGTIQFLKENMFRHASIIVQLIRECQEKGVIRKIPIPIAMSFVMTSVVLPSLVVCVMERAGAKRPMGVALPEMVNIRLSDQSIKLRIEMAL